MNPNDTANEYVLEGLRLHLCICNLVTTNSLKKAEMSVSPEAYLKGTFVLLNGDCIWTENEQESLFLYMVRIEGGKT